jgi:hypothetical protein
MRVLIGLENNNEGRSIAWSLEHFGCIGYGADGQTAVLSMARAVPEYMEWMKRHTSEPWFDEEEIDIRLVDVHDDYFIDKEFNPVASSAKLVKAWFKTDWKPLSQTDAEHALQILSWSRRDLLDLVSPLSDAQLDRRYEGEIWSIREILAHLARAEWWLLNNIDRAHDEALIPDDAFERLIHERGWVVNTLPDLIDVRYVVGKEGELWSPRKVVRRLCWHERDHIQHISRLLLEGAA